MRGRRHDAALDGEHATDLGDGGVERADDLRQRGQEDVAEGVAGQLAAIEAVPEEPVHQRLVLGQRDQAVADVARRRHRQVAPQAAAGAAVVGQRDDRRDLRAGELETAQERRQARAAAQADDAQLAARAHAEPSRASSCCLCATPCEPYSPSEPSARTTRCAGSSRSSGQRAQNAPAARGALGPTGACRELAVGDALAPPDARQGKRDRALEIGQPELVARLVETERLGLEVHAAAAQVAREGLDVALRGIARTAAVELARLDVAGARGHASPATAARGGSAGRRAARARRCPSPRRRRRPA